MSKRPARLPRRISHSTPPSTTYSRDYDDYDDDKRSRGWRRGSANDYHRNSHRRRRSVKSEDGTYRDPRDRHSHRSRRRGRSIDSEDGTFHEPRDKRSHRSRRRGSIDSEDGTYHDDPRDRRSHQSRGRDRNTDSQDKYYHSGDEGESPSRRGRHRSMRHPLRGSYRSLSRSSSTSPSSSSDGDFDCARDPSPKKPGHLRCLACSASRLGRRRQPSPSSRSSSPPRSRSQSKSHKDRSKSNPPYSSSKHNESNPPADIIYTAVRTAFEAGAVAALKLRNDPSPLLGAKGGKIAAAAIGAAAVDTFIDRKHPKRKGGLRHTIMRQATQMAIGNLVMPAIVQADKRHGKGVPVQTSVRGKGAWPGRMKATGVTAGGGVRAGGGRR